MSKLKYIYTSITQVCNLSYSVYTHLIHFFSSDELQTGVRWVYPYFFSIFPILVFYSANSKEFEIGVIFFPIFLSLVFFIFLCLVLNLFFRDFYRSSLVLLVIILYFFSFGYCWEKYHINHNLFLIFYTFFFCLLLFLLLRIKQQHHLTIFFNIIGLYLIASSFFAIIPYEIKRRTIKKIDANDTRIVLNRSKASRPNIYYLIFDRYANSQILKDYYHYDNTDFIEYLKKKGFYLAEKSFANYPKTHLSLASSLNLDYLDEYIKTIGRDNSDYTPVFDLVSDNRVARSLKSLGYRYLYFGDWWNPTRLSKLADKNINLFVNSDEFSRKFMGTTVITSLLGNYYQGNNLFGLFHDRVFKNINYKLDRLAKVAKEKGPRFVFSHMLFPHYPYVFDANCQRNDSKFSQPDKKRYIDQLKCTNMKIINLIDAIITADSQAIIILQSDEGPFWEEEMKLDGEGVDWSKVSDDAKKIHMKILNAYYLPGFDYSQLYPEISPVNSFRIIFNRYFQTNLEILDDKSFFINHLNRPYQYVDVTKVISK